MSRQGIYVVVILLGLIVALSFYTQRQTMRSSAFEQTGQVKVYVDSRMCSGESVWQENGYSSYPNGLKWRVRHYMDNLTEIHLQRGSTITEYTNLWLGNSRQSMPGQERGSILHIPETVTLTHSCAGAINFYAYKCLTDACYPPDGEQGQTLDVNAFQFIRMYKRKNAPQSADWARTPGKYLLTPWCDANFFPCKDGGVSTN